MRSDSGRAWEKHKAPEIYYRRLWSDSFLILAASNTTRTVNTRGCDAQSSLHYFIEMLVWSSHQFTSMALGLPSWRLLRLCLPISLWESAISSSLSALQYSEFEKVICSPQLLYNLRESDRCSADLVMHGRIMGSEQNPWRLRVVDTMLTVKTNMNTVISNLNALINKRLKCSNQSRTLRHRYHSFSHLVSSLPLHYLPLHHYV